jgi:predicted Zn-dependent protease
LASDEKPGCRGDWHPRDSSRSVPSRLIARDGQIRAVAEDGTELASTVFSKLDISPRVGSIPRRVEFADGSLFETTDNAAIDSLQLANGRKRAGLIHGLERFHPRLLVFVAAVFLLSGLVYRYALPAMVEVAVAVTPPVVPRLMSISTLETLDRTVLSETKLDDTRWQAISDGFARIAKNSTRGPSAYTLNFRKGGAIGPNAFALPDGTLIITDELVDLSDGDTEMLIGVLAHEIGHVELEHSLRQIYRAAGMAGLIMLIAGDVGDSVEDLLVQGGGLLALSYSRDAEAAADRHSVELMQKAGYDPTAIARFFEIIEKKLGDTSETNILSTHPGAPDRRKAIDEYEAELRAKQAGN